MNTYRCQDCGAVFAPEDSATHKEWHSLDGQQFAECWAACPVCGGTDLEDVSSCPICEETWTEGNPCQACKKEIRAQLNSTMALANTKDGKEAVLDEIINFVEGYET